MSIASPRMVLLMPLATLNLARYLLLTRVQAVYSVLRDRPSNITSYLV